MRIAVAALMMVLGVIDAFSQSPSAPLDFEAIRLSKIAQAVRITEKITLDGRLEESVWNLALPISDFVQTRPFNGQAPRERTEVRILYDETNIYFGWKCFDSAPQQITITDLKEDFNFGESDVVFVIIDSLHDRRSSFAFAMNAAGARRDEQVSNDTQFNPDWDGVWDGKVSRNDEGWLAEFVIPFKTLRFSRSESQEWGLNLGRRILRINEDDYWSPSPIRRPAFATSSAGVLQGLEGIHQGRNLMIKPFVTAGVTQVLGPGGELETTKSLADRGGYDGGVDLKYSLTPSLTLDMTYRTDFAQVEVDQQQVNLTRFNLFFPEKRDFFLENAGLFNFGLTGTGPGSTNTTANLVPFFSRRIGLSASGTPIPILGGARVTGKIDRYDIGVLAMKTRRLDTTPSDNLFVGRIRRNLSMRNSWLGTLVTNRDSTTAGDYNRVYGGDVHLQFYDRLEFDSYLLRSDTPAKHGRNQARRFQTAWKDDEFTATGEYNEVQENFNPEMGFVRRRNVTQYKGDVAWKPLLDGNDTIRNLNFETTMDYNEGSTSGKIETRTAQAQAGMIFQSNASMTFLVDRTFDRLANPLRIPAGNPRVAIAAGDYEFQSYSTSFRSNSRRKISGNGTILWGDFYNGQRKSLSGGFSLKPNYHLTLSLTYDRNDVQLPGGSFVTNLVGARFAYSFTPRAFFNAFIQYNADTHQVSSNLRFNVIHHPLSDLYIVYNDRRDTITGQPLERALIVKLTNLFTF